ncbi:MAG TPA: lysylphosphatidylglycerol synthase transmembrane domain-containing protein, partial [Candidatus Eisenbacteria bacterium]
ISRGVATAAVVVNLLSFYAAYAIAVGATLLALWLHRRPHPAVFVLVTAFAAYATAVPILILWIVYGGPRARPAWLARIPGLSAALRAIEEAPASTLRHPLLFLESTALQLLIVIADVATLDVLLRALGQHAEFSIIFSSFVLSSIAGTVSLLPGGIGSFEAGSVASLHYLGVPIEAALAGTILLRAFTAWLPMIPGLWFARREMAGLGARG